MLSLYLAYRGDSLIPKDGVIVGCNIKHLGSKKTEP